MTEQEAIAVAAKYAREQAWTWLEPVECRRKSRWFQKPVFEIRTNASSRGSNIVVTVDAIDGTIVRANFLPR